jgi:hypothetical protein
LRWIIAIVFPAPVDEKRVKKQKSTEENDEEKSKEVPKLQINVFGKVNKDEGIEKMTWAIVDEQKQVLCRIFDCLRKL